MAKPAPPSKTFTVKLVLDGSRCYIPIAFDPVPIFGKLRAPVVVTLAKHSYRNTIFRMGGVTGIPVRRDIRAKTRLRGDERVTVTVALDHRVRQATPTPDLKRALAANFAAREGWRQLSYTIRHEYVDAVRAAKAPATRARRVAKAIEAGVAYFKKLKRMRDDPFYALEVQLDLVD